MRIKQSLPEFFFFLFNELNPAQDLALAEGSLSGIELDELVLVSGTTFHDIVIACWL